MSNFKTPPNFVDLSGQRFKRLTVLRRANDIGERVKWLCECTCGDQAVVLADNLKRGRQQSCGCLKRERSSEVHTRHGAYRFYSETPAHLSWRNMMERCYRKQNNRFPNYGARGIKVCQRWRTYENFLADMGDRPPGLTLERRDSNAGYDLKNCRWATYRDQQNNRRNNRLISCYGKTSTVAQWARETGILYATLYARIREGIAPERALQKKMGRK